MKELRSMPLEVRALEDEMVIEGYALKFDAPATHYGITEVLAKGCLDEADMSDVVMRYNHEDTYLLMARTRNKSLELEVDDIGLRFVAHLIPTQSNKDVYESIKSGLLDKCSFAFTCKEELWDEEEQHRTILKIDKLFDIAVVNVPYYDDTEVHTRNVETAKDYALKKNAESKRKLLNRMEKEELLKKIIC